MGAFLLPRDNSDVSVRRWVRSVLEAQGEGMLSNPRERASIADWLMADLDPRSRLILEALEHRYDEGELTLLQDHLRQVCSGVPVQRVVGWTEFRGLRIGCSGDVLIPRPETEEVVGWFLEGMAMVKGDEAKRVLDIGTGSGCMALALKAENPSWDVVGVDVSEAALNQAKTNAIELGLDVTWVALDALDSAAVAALGRFDGIVSNPPYIPSSEVLEPHVQDHEPALALFVPDNEPLRFYNAMVPLVTSCLVSGGCMVAECHTEFTKEVADCWKLEGAQVQVLCDLQGAQRAVRLIRS
jgi:release factor glutamine methyltransferase